MHFIQTFAERKFDGWIHSNAVRLSVCPYLVRLILRDGLRDFAQIFGGHSGGANLGFPKKIRYVENTILKIELFFHFFFKINNLELRLKKMKAFAIFDFFHG